MASGPNGPSSIATASTSSQLSNGTNSGGGVRVLHVERHVALDPLPAHRGRQHLPQRPVRAVSHRFRHPRPPARDLERAQLPDRLCTEGVRRLDEVVPQPAAARRRALVLLEEGVDELLQRDVGPVERPQTRLAQLVVEDRLRLALRAEAALLSAAAACVAVPDRPAARRALDLARPDPAACHSQPRSFGDQCRLDFAPAKAHRAPAADAEAPARQHALVEVAQHGARRDPRTPTSRTSSSETRRSSSRTTSLTAPTRCSTSSATPKSASRTRSRSGCPPAEEAATLQIGPGTPVACLSRIGYDADDTPVRLFSSVLPGDRYTLVYDVAGD